jgi:Flp pilus assembly protein TadG
LTALLRRVRRHRAGTGRGQTLAEFALALPIFLFILMAIFDFGRAIYMYNGVSQAARELARVTSVHRCAGNPCTLGASAETTAVLNTQRSLIPNLQTPTYTCVDIDGSTINTATTCLPGNQVKVRIVARYAPITPLLGLTGTWDLQSTSSVSIQ